jgi:hypothetical protein
MGIVIRAKSVFETVARGEEFVGVVVHVGDIRFWAGKAACIERSETTINNLLTNESCGLYRVVCHSVGKGIETWFVIALNVRHAGKNCLFDSVTLKDKRKGRSGSKRY